MYEFRYFFLHTNIFFAMSFYALFSCSFFFFFVFISISIHMVGIRFHLISVAAISDNNQMAYCLVVLDREPLTFAVCATFFPYEARATSDIANAPFFLYFMWLLSNDGTHMKKKRAADRKKTSKRWKQNEHYTQREEIRRNMRKNTIKYLAISR